MINMLYKLLEIESYSSNGKIKCCEYLANVLKDMGYRVNVIDQNGVPLIEAFAGDLNGSQILIYSHYDVKPPGNEKEWRSPPFIPHNDGNRIYARGAGDAKGQVYALISGIAEYFKRVVNNRIGITLIIEGNEESGSPDLEEYFQKLLPKRNYIFGMMIDSHWFFDKPLISIGTRGQLSINLIVEDDNIPYNLHAGNYGGIYEGAAIKAIYEINNLFDMEFIKRFREKKYDKALFQNACTVSYIQSGDQERSLIPKKCTIKIDFRFDKNQDVGQLLEKLSGFCNNRKIKMEILQNERAAYSIPNANQLQIISDSLHEATMVKPLIEDYIGAYLPMEKLKSVNVPIYIIPFAQFDEHNHAPNENISLKHIEIGKNFMCKMLFKLNEKDIDIDIIN